MKKTNAIQANTTPETTATPTTPAATPKKKRSMKKILIWTLVVIFVGMPIFGGLINVLADGVRLLTPRTHTMYEIVSVVDEDTVMMSTTDGDEFEVHLYGIASDVTTLEAYIGSSYSLAAVGNSDDMVMLLRDADGNILQLAMLREGRAYVTISGMDFMHREFMDAATEYIPAE